MIPGSLKSKAARRICRLAFIFAPGLVYVGLIALPLCLSPEFGSPYFAADIAVILVGGLACWLRLGFGERRFFLWAPVLAAAWLLFMIWASFELPDLHYAGNYDISGVMHAALPCLVVLLATVFLGFFGGARTGPTDKEPWWNSIQLKSKASHWICRLAFILAPGPVCVALIALLQRFGLEFSCIHLAAGVAVLLVGGLAYWLRLAFGECLFFFWAPVPAAVWLLFVIWASSDELGIIYAGMCDISTVIGVALPCLAVLAATVFLGFFSAGGAGPAETGPSGNGTQQ